MTLSVEELRALISEDFGITLPISGGSGQTADTPMTIDCDDAEEARLVQINLVTCLGKGRQILWRTAARTIDASKKLEKIALDTIKLTDTEVLAQRENYYFSAVDSTRAPRV